MFRQIPVANKLCFDKELKRSWEIHERKLKNLKCSIDRSRPAEFEFLQSRPKKEVLQQFRNTEIMRENRVLLNKISDISMEGDLNKFLKRTSSSTTKPKKTLNEPYRKRQLVKIVEQNQQMLKRIQERKSCYNNRKMARERQQVERNINLISAFPYKDMKHNKTLVNLWMTNSTLNNERTLRTNESRDDNDIMSKPLTANLTDLKMKKTRTINGQFFLVSSRINVDGKFAVELQNLEESNGKYCLFLSEMEARNFLKVYFGNNLECMLDSLFIDEKEQTCYLKYQVPLLTTDDRNKLPKIHDSQNQLANSNLDHHDSTSNVPDIINEVDELKVSEPPSRHYNQ